MSRSARLSREIVFESGLVLPAGTKVEVFAERGETIGLRWQESSSVSHSFAASRDDVEDVSP